MQGVAVVRFRWSLDLGALVFVRTLSSNGSTSSRSGWAPTPVRPRASRQLFGLRSLARVTVSRGEIDRLRYKEFVVSSTGIAGDRRGACR